MKFNLNEIMDELLNKSKEMLEKNNSVSPFVSFPVKDKMAVVPLMAPSKQVMEIGLGIMGTLARKVQADFIVMVYDARIVSCQQHGISCQKQETVSNTPQDVLCIIGLEFGQENTVGKVIKYRKENDRYVYSPVSMNDAEIGGNFVDSIVTGWKQADVAVNIGLLSDDQPINLSGLPGFGAE